MLAFVPKECVGQETRVALVPSVLERLVRLGLQLEVQSGLGEGAGYPDDDYVRRGATISRQPERTRERADVVVRLGPPQLEEIRHLKRHCLHLSFLEPFKSPHLTHELAKAGVSALSMEFIPRTTLAQIMDALSSQANLAGYAAMILAARTLDKALPMMSTPAGTIQPARVFVIGAGVAGLQAIATARRLGARVEAFDTRPAAQEQIASLGAKALKLELGETGEAQGGYARELSREQLGRQQEAMARRCAAADIVITTAQVFGKPAPRLVTREMIRAMRPGSVIVDVAAASGGNVEGVRPDEETVVHGVRLLGPTRLAAQVPRDASLMYAGNVVSLLEHLWQRDTGKFELDFNDEIVRAALLTHNGQVQREEIRALLEVRA